MSCLRCAALWALLFTSRTLCARHNDIAAVKNAVPQITDSATYVNALNRLAWLYLAGQLGSSGGYARKAKALTAARTAGDSAGAAVAQMNMGTYFQYQLQHTEAQKFLNKALKATWDARLDSIRAWVPASFYLVNESGTATLATAQKALQQAVVLMQQYHDGVGVLYSRLFLAHETLRGGDVQKAEAQLEDVILAADSAGLNYLFMYACMQLAGYRSWQKKPDSLLYQQQAVRYAVAGGYTGLMLPVITSLYNKYLRNGDSMLAAGYSRLALQVLLQQQEDMQAGEADYLSYAFGDEWLDSLRRQHMVRRAQLAWYKSADHFWYYQVLIIGAIAVLLLILLSYLVRAYRLSRKNTASMALLQEEIRIGNNALRENDDFKNKLVSMMAHDFRTPLHNIVNITGFIDEKAITVADAASMIMEVEKTATLGVFEEILRWARTRLSGFVYRPQVLQLEEMLHTTAGNLQHLLSAKEIQLRIDIPPGTAVPGDYEMLQFIHRNFLHNAIKFSPDHGTITVMATRENGWLTLAFTDEGAGIDNTVLPHLFHWNKNTYEQERAGLALIICKDFMDKMGGSIGAENNEEEGSTFYYRLPESLETTFG